MIMLLILVATIPMILLGWALQAHAPDELE